MEEIAQAAHLDTAYVQRLFIAEDVRSLNYQFNADNETELVHLIADSSEKDLDAQMLPQVIEGMLELMLNPREREIIQRRYGLNGYHPHTLQEVGDILSFTRERIRQIEKKATQKLCGHPLPRRKLGVYLQ